MALRMEVGPIAVPLDDFRALDSVVRNALPDKVRVRVVAELSGDDLNDPGPDGSRRRGGLFNGLPVPGVDTGLNVHVDAPFNLDGSRVNILQDAFNEWLIGQVGDAACRFICRLREDDHFRNQIFRLVPADLGYGESKGVGALTQRFPKIHERLREEARRVGVLPALDEGEPLRPEEALCLRASDAKKKEVAIAIQSLIGGRPVVIFAKTGTKVRAVSVRLSALPDESYEAAVAKALGPVEHFSHRWMTAALANPAWLAYARDRDAQWFRHLFTYIKGGYLPDNLEGFLDPAWVPGLTIEDGAIPPREVTLMAGASAEELAIVREGLRAAGVAEVAPAWRFAHPDFTRAYLAARPTADATRGGSQRLARLLAGREVDWPQIIDRLTTLLSSAARLDPSAAGETPAPVWDLIGLTVRKVDLPADSAARLSRLTRVVASSGEATASAPTVWSVCDLLLKPADDAASRSACRRASSWHWRATRR